jgi:hypothetical protein
MEEKTKLLNNHLEIAARAWAADKAREIAGTVVDHTLNHTQATVSDLDRIREGEAFMERFLTAWLKNCTMEFFQMYDAALLEQVMQIEKRLRELVNITLPPAQIR